MCSSQLIWTAEVSRRHGSFEIGDLLIKNTSVLSKHAENLNDQKYKFHSGNVFCLRTCEGNFFDCLLQNQMRCNLNEYKNEFSKDFVITRSAIPLPL